MANALRILSISIITLIAFIYGLNIFLTKQVNDLIYAPKGIEMFTFAQEQVNVVAAPWYNIILSGQHLIYSNDSAYIVIKTTAESVITASASDLVLLTLLAPVNIIILLLLVLAVSWLVNLRFQNSLEKYKFNYSERSVNKNLMLHAYQIKFMINNKKFTYTALLPDYFKKLIKTKRLSFPNS